MRHRLAALLGTTIALAATLAAVGSASVQSTSPASAASTAATSWLGDGSTPLSAEWAAVTDKEHCATTSSSSNLPDKEVSVVSDSRFAEGKAIKFVMPANNNVCYGGRAEVEQGNPYSSSKVDRRWRAGEELWLAWQALVTPQYLKSAGSGGGGMMQIHRTGAGKSPFGMGVRSNGALVVYWLKGSSFEETQIGTISAEKTYDIVVHYVVGSSGSFTVYVSEAGQPVQQVMTRSGVPTNEGEPDLATIGVYPGQYCGCLGELQEEIGGFNAQPTREAAEGVAFRSHEPPKEEPPKEEPPTEEHKELPKEATVPHVPTGLAEVSHGTSIALSYNANPAEDHVTRYDIYRAGANYPGHTTKEPWGTSTSLTFSNTYSVEAGMWICYRISAVNTKGESPMTAPVCVTA